MSRCFYDSWQNIFDVNGKFLVGRLTFLEPNTSGRKLTIYDTDGNELDNPIYTSQYGLPKYQIMLQDRDYKVTFEMYIGNGNMEADENESSWLLYKTISSVNGNLTTEQNTATPTFVNTIAEMKALSGMQDGATAIVSGYYTLGDSGASRMYVWHQHGNYTDDGGITIKSNNTTTGAWIMTIPYNYIDVRWYGDIPDGSAKPTTQKSNLGQRSRAAHAANLYDKHLYFAARQNASSASSYYIFDGSNTVSVDQDIICDSAVRFVVKEGTTGTTVTCKSLQKPTKHLFLAESQQQQIGGYTLTADWINTSWLSSNDATARNARVGYVIDQLKSPLIFNNCKIKVERDGINMSCTFNNCEMVECYKQITKSCTMQNMVVKTDWFADDYNWSDLFMYNTCTILLQNCKDANTYILLKNKIVDYNYGDLGEQSINATIYPGGTLENCFGTVTLGSHGNFEFHNVSLTLSNASANDYFNAVDSWLTFSGNTIISHIDLRRGDLAGTSMKILNDSLIDNATINIALTTLGTHTVIKNSTINAAIDATELELDHNDICATVQQCQNSSNIILIKCVHNTFKVGGQHYLKSDQTTGGTLVYGEWVANACDYDTAHWIRIDRTNLVQEDYKHRYSYVGNQEPYLDKFSGFNWQMKFALYKGHLGSTERGIFATTNIPFLWVNTGTNQIFAVNRSACYWKMFTVGCKSTRRVAHIRNNQPTVGIADGDYSSYNVRHTPVVWSWEKGSGSSVMQAICFDSPTAEASYVWSFESATQDHTTSDYSNGIELGCLAAPLAESWNVPAVYPASPFGSWLITIFIEKDVSMSNGGNATTVGWDV